MFKLLTTERTEIEDVTFKEREGDKSMRTLVPKGKKKDFLKIKKIAQSEMAEVNPDASSHCPLLFPFQHSSAAARTVSITCLSHLPQPCDQVLVPMTHHPSWGRVPPTPLLLSPAVQFSSWSPERGKVSDAQMRVLSTRGALGRPLGGQGTDHLHP